MTEIEMLMICIGAGFSGTWMMMFYMLNRIDKRLDCLEKRITDLDQRVCRIEGAMLNKECCMLAHDHKKKAE